MSKKRFLTTANVTDKEQPGSLTIYKEGEVLTGFNGNFVYQNRQISDAVFTVRANQNIFSTNGNRLYSTGDIDGTLADPTSNMEDTAG